MPVIIPRTGRGDVRPDIGMTGEGDGDGRSETGKTGLSGDLPV